MTEDIAYFIQLQVFGSLDSSTAPNKIGNFVLWVFFDQRLLFADIKAVQTVPVEEESLASLPAGNSLYGSLHVSPPSRDCLGVTFIYRLCSFVVTPV